MRILAVDDEETSLEILRNLLTQSGYEVETARNGKEALQKLHDSTCRMVVSDWEMPEMNGEALCRAIRSANLTGYVYVILLTIHGSSEYTIRGLEAGADDFVSKPFNPAELAVRIRAGERILALETRDVALFALAKLAESRDPETGFHLERMQNYSRVLAQHLSLMGRTRGEVTAEYVQLIYQTSPLHDIGKVGIPDAVLLKPGRLNDREFDIMKMHALLGAETLEAALKKYPGAKYLLMARDIAVSHHERYNGTGYPHHLVGERIPLCGRIVALADVYDALTSKRVYKQAFSHDISRSMILKDADTHFDPKVVQAFTDMEDRFVAVQEDLRDESVPSGSEGKVRPCLQESGSAR